LLPLFIASPLVVFENGCRFLSLNDDKSSEFQFICSPEIKMPRRLDYLDDVKVFVSVDEHGSLTGGAIAVGKPGR
jgi:hypothetical protein